MRLLSPASAALDLGPPASRAAAPAAVNPFFLEVIAQVATNRKHRPRRQSRRPASGDTGTGSSSASRRRKGTSLRLRPRVPGPEQALQVQAGGGGQGRLGRRRTQVKQVRSDYPPGCDLGQGSFSQCSPRSPLRHEEASEAGGERGRTGAWDADPGLPATLCKPPLAFKEPGLCTYVPKPD